MRQLPITLALLVIVVLAPSPAVADEPLAADPIPERASLELLDPGEGERRELRYDFDPGSEETMVVIMHMSMSMDAQGQQIEMTMPAMRMTMTVAVTEVTEEGDYRQSFELTDADVDARPEDAQMMVDAMRQQLGQMRGMRGTSLITPLGKTHDIEIELPEGAPPQLQQQMAQLQQSMEHMTIMLPTEPLGVGARWRVVMPVRTEQFDMVQRISYTLRERDGDRVTLASEFEQAAPPQQMGEAMGQAIELRSYAATGAGEVEIDLRGLVPRGEMTMDTEMETAFGDHAQQYRMNMQMHIQPGDDDAAHDDHRDGAPEPAPAS